MFWRADLNKKKLGIGTLIFGIVVAAFFILENVKIEPSRSEAATASGIVFDNPSAGVRLISKKSQAIADLIQAAREEKRPTRDQIVQDIATIARERKMLILSEVERNPLAVYLSFLPNEVIVSTPAEVRNNFESFGTIQGVVRSVHYDDFVRKSSRLEYYIQTSEGEIRYYPTSKNIQLVSGSEIQVSGYRLDNIFVGPGQSDSLRVIRFGNLDALGDQKTLVVLVNFLDSPNPEPNLDDAYRMVFESQVQAFYAENSYRQMSWSGDVIGWYTIQRLGSPNGYPQWPWLCVETWCEDEGVYDFVQAQGKDIRDYGRVLFLVYHPDMNGGFSDVGKYEHVLEDGTSHRFSISYVGGFTGDYNAQRNFPFPWTNFDYIVSHELGHALGIFHANRWECAAGTVLYGTDCMHVEYGNFLDVMGTGDFAAHFNAMLKNQLGWLRERILNINAAGMYTIQTLESESGVKGARVSNSYLAGSIPFYIEFRKGDGFDEGLDDERVRLNQNGVITNWDSFIRGFDLPSFSSRLLDVSPVAGDYLNIALLDGNVFRARGHGITIGPITRMDDQSVSFRVDVYKPECIRSNPTIWPPPEYLAKEVESGSEIYFSISTFNQDSPSCSASTLSFFARVPPNWTVFPPDNQIFTLRPGQFTISSLTVAVPSGTPTGTYYVSLIVDDKANRRQQTSEVRIDVRQPDPPPTNSFTPSPTVTQTPSSTPSSTLSPTLTPSPTSTPTPSLKPNVKR